MFRKVQCRALALMTVAILAIGACLPASASEGGTPLTNGLEPRISVRDAVVGKVAIVTVSNLPESVGTVYVAVSRRYLGDDVSDDLGPGAILVPDVDFDPDAMPPIEYLRSSNGGTFSRFLSKRIGTRMAGRTLYVQALVQEEGNPYRYALTDGIAVTIKPTSDSELTLRTAGNLPNGRDKAAVAHDSESGVTYVFGGHAEGVGPTDEILAFDPGKPFGYQVEVLPERLPEPRSGVSAVWNSNDGVAYVFGGPDQSRSYGEILVFDPSLPEGQRLNRLYDTLPLDGIGSTAVWDANRELAYVFASVFPDGKIFEFDPRASSGQRVRTLVDELPDGRVSASAVWNPNNGVTYVFGGSFVSKSDDIVEFDPSRPAGSRVRVLGDRLPSPRAQTTAVWHSSRDVALVFGGDDASSWRQVVEFDPSRASGSRVTELDLELLAPSIAAGAIYDAARDCAFLVGGRDDQNERQDHIWVARPYDEVIRKIDQYPSGRYAAAVCTDASTGVMYSFGGRGEEVLDEIVAIGGRDRILDQSYALVDKLPSARYYACAAWDPIRKRAYVFGGRDSRGSAFQDIVEFDPRRPEGSRVVRLPDTIPFPLSGAKAVWDDVDSVAYIIGGIAPVGEILRFDPSAAAGQRLTVTSDSFPFSRVNPGVVWDDRRKVAYVFGGSDISRLDEIVEFDPRRPAGQRLITLPDRLPTDRSSVGALWSNAENVAYILGGDDPVGGHQLVRFDPARPAGQRVSVVGTTEWATSLAPGAFDPVAKLPMFLGGYRSLNEGRSTFLTFDWR